MPQIKINSVSIKGFRSYGPEVQTLNLAQTLTTIWAPNSKGKTSLAEAIEFLLTGRIVRRELMASTQDEFSDALRNAHLSSNAEVYVAAALIASDGTEHQVKRTLERDYGKRQDCETKLEINGAPAEENNLERLGVTFSQPPLNIPVLAQHTLAYIFSVRPQDRSTYFKALLEVADLEQLRNAVANLVTTAAAPYYSALSKLESVRKVEALAEALKPLEDHISDSEHFHAIISTAAKQLIETIGEVPPDSDADRLSLIKELLDIERNRTFATKEFNHAQFLDRSGLDDETWTPFETYFKEHKKVEEDTRTLLGLFAEILKVPNVADIEQPLDCPVCEAEQSLTPARVQTIRQHVEQTRDFDRAESNAKSTLAGLESLARSLSNESQTVIPQFLKLNATQRREKGFTVERIRQLIGDDQTLDVNDWLSKIKPLRRNTRILGKHAADCLGLVEKQRKNLGDLDVAVLKENFSMLMQSRRHAMDSLKAYDEAAKTVIDALNLVLDAHSNTQSWQEFIEIFSEPEALRSAMVESTVSSVVKDDLQRALKEIDRAKEEVLNDKFFEHSRLVCEWWDRLRPEEPAFFSEVKPRKGAKRTIDLKVGLAVGSDRTSVKLRDAIAVFSHSQIHCLGLALFLAKVEREAAGFIVLDDPVLSSDEDYRVHFNTTVISELLDKDIQVIILTQDHDTFEELETRYRHRGVSNAQIHVELPEEGSLIENTSDTLLAKITRARSLAKGGHPDSRKECGIQLRDAGERFCKEMLVNDERKHGKKTASLSDYEKKTLEWLVPRVQKLLDHDPSHSGKLEAFKKIVNDACHDNSPPSSGAMTQACGEINFLQKEYLPR